MMLMVIDWSFWLTVVGTIATVVFGIWAILLAKKRVYPGEITFFHDRSIRLFDDITGSLPQVTVSYKGEPVKKNLTLIKGFLVNTGAKDITNEMVEKPLNFELVEGYHWLEASAKLSTNSEERAKIIEPKSVEFSLGLFRCNEFLRFEGLIEVSEGKKWGGTIMTSHRIADTADTKWKKVPSKPDGLIKDFKFWSIVIFLLFASSACIYHLMKMSWVMQNWRELLLTSITGFIFAFLSFCVVILLPMSNRFDRKMRKILRLDSD